MDLNQIIKTAKSKGYTIDTRPFALNLIGIRNSNPLDQNKFDDNIAYFYYDDNNNLYGEVAPSTTDPSTYYLENPMMPSEGAAVLKSGEYRDTWQIGLHKGKYEALVQVKPVSVIRDNDRNAYINYFAPTKEGLFGINIHKASIKNDVSVIDKDSAGCQVFRDISDFNKMMSLAKISRAKYGNSFSYILIDQRDTIKKRNTWILGAALIAFSLSLYLYKKYNK